MKSIGTNRSEIIMLIWEAKLLVAEFTVYHFQHIHLLGNRAAHLMAKEGFQRQCDSWWIEDGPVTIQGLVHAESILAGRVTSTQ